jgi:hypothetical protein
MIVMQRRLQWQSLISTALEVGRLQVRRTQNALPSSFSILHVGARQCDDYGLWSHLIPLGDLFADVYSNEHGVNCIWKNGNKRLNSIGKKAATKSIHMLVQHLKGREGGNQNVTVAAEQNFWQQHWKYPRISMTRKMRKKAYANQFSDNLEH